MKTISFVTQKGGAGKSTLCIACSVAAIEDGKRVLVLDTDPQQTVYEWWQRREAEAPIVGFVASNELEENITKAAANGFDYIFVDTGGKSDPSTHAAIKVADFCVVPCRPTIADISAVRDTIETAKKLTKPIGFVLTQTLARERKDKLQQAAALNAFGVLAPVRIVSRGDYQDSQGVGQGVTEYDPEGKAAQETKELWQWIKNRTNKISFTG